MPLGDRRVTPVLQRHEYLRVVIPGHSRNANEPGIHNHRQESLRAIVVAPTTFHVRLVVMDSGLALRAPRNDGEIGFATQ